MKFDLSYMKSGQNIVELCPAIKHVLKNTTE